MQKSASRLIRIADPDRPSVPHHKISAEEPPVRIFENDKLESLTFISFRTFLIFCFIFETAALTISFFYKLSFWSFLWHSFLGFFIWFITEYILHRFVFHFESDNKLIQHMIYVIHGNHHIQPNHPLRTIMPLIVTIPLGMLIWGLSIWGAGIGSGSAFFTGFFAGYTLYDAMHFATHNFKMKGTPLSLWKKHHLLHHYQTEEHNFSITMPWLDNLFHSLYIPPRKKK
ncbi:sterol desaturase family protein [Acetobacteraceae bacterium ESL0697]|nr:sterol desaturase family protein [Acetobacteraceae bacterium ESL0697]